MQVNTSPYKRCQLPWIFTVNWCDVTLVTSWRAITTTLELFSDENVIAARKLLCPSILSINKNVFLVSHLHTVSGGLISIMNKFIKGSPGTFEHHALYGVQEDFSTNDCLTICPDWPSSKKLPTFHLQKRFKINYSGIKCCITVSVLEDVILAQTIPSIVVLSPLWMFVRCILEVPLLSIGF